MEYIEDSTRMSDDEDVMYFEGRKKGYIYLSKKFPFKVNPNSRDYGKPVRYVHHVSDLSEPEKIELEFAGEAWPIYTSDKGRVQIQLLIAQDNSDVKEIIIQKVEGYEFKGKPRRRVKNVLTFRGDDARYVCTLFQALDHLDMKNGSRVRLDFEGIRELISNPEELKELRLEPKDARLLTEHLVDNDSSLADVIAVAARRKVVRCFEKMLDTTSGIFEEEEKRLNKTGEAVWQWFFEQNPWLLGLGLSNQLLTSWDQDKLEQVVSGYSINSDGKRADALMRTSGYVRSMVFAEIKRPDTPLLQVAHKGNEYRSAVWRVSSELSGAVSQAQVTVAAATKVIGERILAKDSDGADIDGDWTYFHQPRSFVIVGSLSDLVGEKGDYQDKIRSFELYRRNLWSPEIITFDELLERAKWIVGASKKDSYVAE